MSQDASRQPIEILLVEDNPGDVRLIKEAFKDSRINDDMHVVMDGTAALDFLHQRGDYEDSSRPDIILLDLRLPCMSGIEVLNEIKMSSELTDIPVVLLTASETEGELVSRDEEDVTAFLTKPVDPDEFLDLARRLLAFGSG